MRWLGLSICVDSFGWSAVGLCCDPSCCAGDFLLLEAEQFCHSQRVQSVSHHSQLVPGVVPVNWIFLGSLVVFLVNQNNICVLLLFLSQTFR